MLVSYGSTAFSLPVKKSTLINRVWDWVGRTALRISAVCCRCLGFVFIFFSMCFSSQTLRLCVVVELLASSFVNNPPGVSSAVTITVIIEIRSCVWEHQWNWHYSRTALGDNCTALLSECKWMSVRALPHRTSGRAANWNNSTQMYNWRHNKARCVLLTDHWRTPMWLCS